MSPSQPAPDRDLRALFKAPPRELSIFPILHGLCRLAERPGDRRRQVGHLVGQEEGRTGAGPSALDAEIARLARRGFGGVVTNPGWGPDYLENWAPFRRVVHALERAGFVIWLYDEKGYPSGSAGGRVLEADPGLEAVGMMAYRYPRLLRGPCDYRADAPDGRLHRALLLPAQADRENSAVRLAGRVDVTGRADRRGTLRFEVPPGLWALLMLFTRKQYDATHAMLSYSEPRRYINLLDRRAGRAFVRVTHERCYQAAPASFGRSIRAVFTDEPALQPPLFDNRWPYAVLPWKQGLAAEFRRRYGYDAEEALLAAAVAACDRRAAARRCDFWEFVSEAVADGFFRPIEEWCARRGIAATGHLLAEENVAGHVKFEGSYFRAMDRFHVPGMDQLNARVRGLMASCVTAKLAASAAHARRRPLVMTEASDHSERMRRERPVSPAEVRGSLNWHFALGVNVVTSYFRLDRFPDAAMRRLNACAGRLALMLRRGAHAAPVAVLYPTQTLWAGTIRGLPAGEAAAAGKAFQGVTDALLGAQLDFDYLDEGLLGAARAAGGCLHLGAERFSALVLPAVTMLDRGSMRVIRRFLDCGGAVAAVGRLPFRSRERGEDAAFRRAVRRLAARRRFMLVPDAGAAFLRAMRGLDIADVVVRPRCPDILYHRRREPGRDTYLLVNMGRRSFRGRVEFAARGRGLRWDPVTGAVRGLDVSRRAPGRCAARLSIPALGAAVCTFG